MHVRPLHPSLLPEQDAAVAELEDRFISEAWTSRHLVRVLCARCGEMVGHVAAYINDDAPATVGGDRLGDAFIGQLPNQPLRRHLGDLRGAGVDTGDPKRDTAAWTYTVLLDHLEHDPGQLPVWCSRDGDLSVTVSAIKGAKAGARRRRKLQTIRVDPRGVA